MSRVTIFLGMDESNHGVAESKRNSDLGEIVVGAYSFNKKYWAIRNRKKGRHDISSIDFEGVGYLYAVVPHQIASANQSNLPLVAPLFVSKLQESFLVDDIKIGLDGWVDPQKREELREFMKSTFSPNSTVRNFIKKGKLSESPIIVYYADIIARDLHQRGISLSDQRYIPFI